MMETRKIAVLFISNFEGNLTTNFKCKYYQLLRPGKKKDIRCFENIK